MNAALPILDSFQRQHTSLRISVTDRCNIRCVYCMPETVTFLPKKDVLTFEEIVRLVKVLAPLGVNQLRLTGGEPLVRSQLASLISMLRDIEGIDDLAMTTNGVLLADQADILKAAGLNRINISLDTVDSDLFKAITRRDVLAKVLRGIEAAQAAGFENIRLNAVPLPSLPDTELVKLAQFAKLNDLELRFIEFMPLDADQAWEAGLVRSGSDLRALIQREVGVLDPVNRIDDSQPAVDFQYRDSDVRIGFIDSVTAPFCGTCNRMRITAEGSFRNCLFSNAEWDLRPALRNGTDAEIESIVRTAIANKKLGHGSDDGSFLRPEKAMYQIGG